MYLTNQTLWLWVSEKNFSVIFFIFCNLATFYTISLPHMRYAISSNIVDLPVDLKNQLNTSITTFQTNDNKRKKIENNENEENEV
jgi:hypothetical protein